ncbi:RimK-like protein [Pseudomonas lini]|uniref:RimK-like protein n=2 Tax=Pseudomonas lini TaxID=163011 RepID=A0A7V7NYS7_9PSED|nr:RimK-like protein [Pseudomonas lini]KAB0497179.1 RimK-like protein [Pseudomonas lini]KMM93795.1 RimK-like protein [Pseudomonas lini]
MSNNTASVLILSSLLDFPTDRICHHLTNQKVPFLRINRDALNDLSITVDPIKGAMICRHGRQSWFIDESLRSVWWRQPTFLRNSPNAALLLEEQLKHSQWEAFMRGLMLFDDAVWNNHPAATYQAESKPYQLRKAAKLGFSVPLTIITNDRYAEVSKLISEDIAIKSIDTLLLRENSKQHFGYTTLTTWSECADEFLHLAPVTCQSIITPKIDLRVTVIGNKLWCDEIRMSGDGIDGDWRLIKKDELVFRSFSLPTDIEKKCFLLVKNLGLRYGAIDLAFSEGVFWFIEINPTGEWGWLDRPGRGISEAIAAELTCPSI